MTDFLPASIIHNLLTCIVPSLIRFFHKQNNAVNFLLFVFCHFHFFSCDLLTLGSSAVAPNAYDMNEITIGGGGICYIDR